MRFCGQLLIRLALQGKCVLSLIDHYGYEIGTIFAEMFDFLLNQLHYPRETLFREGRIRALFFPCI